MKARESTKGFLPQMADCLRRLCGRADRADWFKNIDTVVFVDNRFPNCFDQLEYLFVSGFLPIDRTLLVARFYPSSFRGILRAGCALGVKLHFFRSLSGIPEFAPGTMIYYPYNGIANPRLILKSQYIHLFVGHGDSNKKASVNPMLRSYDHVLVSGKLSKERLIDNRIFLRSDLERTRVLDIGDTAVDISHARLFKYEATAPCRFLGYFPTWEGGGEAENYSSLACDNIHELLISACRRLDLTRVLVDPHPNVGARDRSYKQRLIDLIARLTEAGLDVRFVEKGSNAAMRNSVVRKLGNHLKLAPRPVLLGYGLLDVSAIEAILAVARIPTSVLLPHGRSMNASFAYWNLRKDFIIRLPAPSNHRAVFGDFGFQTCDETYSKFIDGTFSYFDSSMVGMSAAERFGRIREVAADSWRKKIRELDAQPWRNPGALLEAGLPDPP